MNKIFSINKNLFISAFVIIILSIVLFSQIVFASENSINKSEDININGMGISFGNYSGTSFGPVEYSLDKYNGQYVNFWIKNIGKVNVKIKINDDTERIFEPGEGGHISAQFSEDTEEDFVFKAVPTPNGGEIDIEYGIAQRHTNQ